jgi:hypothetical protein
MYSSVAGKYHISLPWLASSRRFCGSAAAAAAAPGACAAAAAAAGLALVLLLVADPAGRKEEEAPAKVSVGQQQTLYGILLTQELEGCNTGKRAGCC